MNERWLISAFFALLSLLPVPALGEAGWTNYTYVTELISSNQLRYLVKLKEPVNPSGCRNKTVFYQDQGSFGSEQMFRILLEALSTGKMVRVYVTGNCELNGYSEISSVSIIP